MDVIASAESMPFRDGSFSTVHAINPFGFQAVSAETARVMKSGGMLMATPARSNKWKRADGGEIPAGAKFETRIYRKK
ncbi:hypothetical protein [Streptomyces sp. 147326]|uniref:hypothetical protein n=1 Tax=Streptomyces sp. 147326 TaxID=3074379 RepID=UPI0038577C54